VAPSHAHVIAAKGFPPSMTHVRVTLLPSLIDDSSILITIISYDYLNVSLADEHVGDVIIPTQVIEYDQTFI
jgi:hypothetical protein